MPEDERELYGLLIEGIASRLYRMQYSETGSFKRDGVDLIVDAPFYYHMHETTFEQCSELLWRLGILRSIAKDNGWDCIFRFVSLPEHAASAAGFSMEYKPSFLEVL